VIAKWFVVAYLVLMTVLSVTRDTTTKGLRDASTKWGIAIGVAIQISVILLVVVWWQP
jgi:hypothetical protein